MGKINSPLSSLLVRLNPDLDLDQEFMRCIRPGCQRLLGPEMIRTGVCRGHKMMRANSSTLWEDILLIAGKIR